jgi:uncharacterized protein YraI
MNPLRKAFKTAACAAFISLVCAVSAAATVGVGTVTANDCLNMRSAPNTNNPVICTAPSGAQVAVLDYIDGWYKVGYQRNEGYMCADYLSVVGVDNALLGTAWVKGDDVCLRSGPGTDYSVIYICEKGFTLNVIGINNGWIKAETSKGTGYVRADFVSFQGIDLTNSSGEPGGADTYETPEPSSFGQSVVDCAKQYLGVRYVYGGASPSGFDCSGFVYYVFGQLGVPLERVAYNQYYGKGTYVSRENLLPGDLVFFTYGSNSVGHVGIYIGNGEFIHATSGSRYCVAISSLSESNYVERYVGAKRVA